MAFLIPKAHLFADSTPNLAAANLYGTTLTLLYDINISQNATDPSYYVLHGASNSVGISNVSVTGNSVVLTLTGNVSQFDSITLDYTNLGSGIIDSNTGNSVDFAPDFTGQPVTDTNTYGCTDPSAVNYNSSANIDNGSCQQVVLGCTDPSANNYNPSANTDDGSCSYNAAVLQSFTSTTANGTYGLGATVNITATFNMGVSGSFDVTLNSGGTASLTSSGGSAMTGTYSVGLGESASDLTIIGTSNINISDAHSIALSSVSVPSSPNNISDTSNIVIDAARPTLSTATINGSTLTLHYDKSLDTGSVPDTSDFGVTVNGSFTPTLNSVTIGGPSNTNVILTLATPVIDSDTVIVDYTPGVNPIQRTGGIQALGFGNQSVTNSTPDTTSPTLSSASIATSTIALTYSETLASTTLATSNFSVMIDSATSTVISASTIGNIAYVTIADTVLSGQTITVNYTATTPNYITDVAGNHAGNLGNQSVTNSAPDVTPPTLSSASVTSTTLSLQFNEALKTTSGPATSSFAVLVNNVPMNVTAVNFSGSDAIHLTLQTATVYDDIVTVSYTPGIGSIQDTSNNAALAFSNQSVTNSNGALCDYINLGSLGTGSYPGVVFHNKIYFPYTNGFVPVIDTVANSLKTIVTASGALTAAIVGDKVYISNGFSTSQKTYRIDTSSDTLGATITLPNTSGYFLAAANDKVYAINGAGSTPISVINTQNDTASAITNTKSLYYAISANNELFAGGDGVNVFDTTNSTFTKNITASGTVFSVISGNKIYFTSPTTNKVLVVDSTTNTLVGSISISGPNTLVRVGNKIYVTTASSGLYDIDTTTDTAQAVSAVPTTLQQTVWAASIGTKLYVSSSNNSVYVIDTTNDTLLSTITGISNAGNITAVGDRLYVQGNSGSNDRVYVIDSNTDSLINLCAPALVSLTSTSPDGTYSQGQSVNITANFSKILGTGSIMRLLFDSGGTADLSSVSGTTLSGTYTIGSGQSSPDLKVSSISSSSFLTSIADRLATPNTRNAYSLLASPELTGDTSFNLSDFKNFVVGNPPITVSVGTNPYQLVTVGSLVYVANQGSNSVSVIDSSTNTVTSTITVGAQPYGIAYNSGSKEIYVSNLKGNSVSVIDADPTSLTFNTVTHTISVGIEPYYVASLGSSIYVTNNISGTVSVIDTGTHAVTATVHVGVAPRGIKAHGNDLYVANFGSSYGSAAQGTVSVINSLNNTVTNTISVGSGARGVTVNGSEVYVANFNDGTVSVIDTGTNTVTHTITVGKNPRGTLSLGSNVYIENFDDGTISVINTGTHAVTATVKVGNTPAGMTAVGTDVYLSRFTDGEVSILDTTNNTLKSNVVPDTTPPTISISSPSSGTISSFTPAVSWGDSSMCEYSFDNGNFAALTCANNGSDIATPSSGAHTLTIRGTDSSSNAATTSVSFTYLPTVLRPGSGGGGGGGGSSYVPAVVTAPTSTPSTLPGIIASLEAKLKVLLAQVTALQNPTATTSPTGPTIIIPILFTHPLTYRDIDPEVIDLQKYLNSHGFLVAKTGPGSKGFETNKFGVGTFAALVKFQRSVGISASGYFGPKTIEYLNSHQ